MRYSLLIFFCLVSALACNSVPEVAQVQNTMESNPIADKPKKSNLVMTRAIPQLDPLGRVHKSLSSTDLKIYPQAKGELKTALVFVDFANYSCDDEPVKLAEELTNGDKTSKWFYDQSYGNMTMKFETPVNQWRTMSKSPESYNSKTTVAHAAYIEEALNLYPEIDFTKYHLVVVIPSNKKRLGVGTACFSTTKQYAAKTKHGKINVGVTFGSSSFTEVSYYTLIHELGHTLGLPDTYEYSVKGISHRAVVGAWDLMCDTGNGRNFLGWHRHTLGWLAPERKHFITENEFTVTLSPLSKDKGLAMLAIPANDTEILSKVFVIELALPIREKNKELNEQNIYGEGVLVYSVDSRLGSGKRPVVMYPKSKEISPIYSYTYLAPYLVGDVFTHEDAPFKVEVLSKKGDTYTIKVSKIEKKFISSR